MLGSSPPTPNPDSTPKSAHEGRSGTGSMMCTWFGSLGGAVCCCGFLGNRESGHVLSRERGPGVGGETVPGGAKESPVAGALF